MIVSTTLSGNAQNVIGEALESATGFVDQCLLIDTGITDHTIEVARHVCGDKLVVRSFPWVNDFAAARNAALDFAEEIGADLALTLDTDERLLFKPGWSKEEFDNAPEVDVWFAEYMDRSYMKERIVRLGKGLRWTGPTHEMIDMHDYRRKSVTFSLSFSEVPKNVAQISHKNKRDLDILLKYAPEHPEEARWWCYIGLTYQAMEKHAEALPYLIKAAEMNEFKEYEGKLAVARAAQCYSNLKQYDEGVAFLERVIAANGAEPSYGYFLKYLRHHAKVKERFGTA